MQPLLGYTSTPNLGIESASDFTLKVKDGDKLLKKKNKLDGEARGDVEVGRNSRVMFIVQPLQRRL